MLLYLVRHGETQFNLEGKIQGQLDTPLTDLGLKQAKSAAKRLKHIKFDALYSSDLGRAMQSAYEIAKAIDTEVIPDKLLRERNFGVLQGHTLPEAAAKFPVVANEWRKNDPATRIPEGESTLDVIARCADFLEMLSNSHSADSVVCAVCHGGTLRGLVAALTGIPAELSKVFKFSNAGISILELGDKAGIRLLNETHHAEKMEVTEADADNE